jgi:hypothetical protein
LYVFFLCVRVMKTYYRTYTEPCVYSSINLTQLSPLPLLCQFVYNNLNTYIPVFYSFNINPQNLQVFTKSSQNSQLSPENHFVYPLFEEFTLKTKTVLYIFTHTNEIVLICLSGLLHHWHRFTNFLCIFLWNYHSKECWTNYR